jgi:Pentapeptide repeats (8 copies)
MAVRPPVSSVLQDHSEVREATAMTQRPTPQVDRSAGQRWPPSGWLLAGLAVVVVLFAVVLVTPRLLHPPLTNQELDRQGVTDGKDRIELKREQDKLQNDARGALLQGLGGAVLLLGAYFTWRQVQTSREQLKHDAAATRDQLQAARDQLQLTHEGQITDRFTKAVDQLGSQHLDVRVGGIYALERIARDSPSDRATIEEVLTAFVRGHAPWPPPLTAPAQPALTQQPTTDATPQPPSTASPAKAAGRVAQPDQVAEPHGPAADVQAVVTVLGRRLLPLEGPRPLDLTGVDLRGAWLGKADLQRARLTDANLQGARLEGANLRDAWLRGADLQGARLEGANLEGTWLPGANLRGTNLDDVSLGGARAGSYRGGPETRWPEEWTLEEPEHRGVYVGDFH